MKITMKEIIQEFVQSNGHRVTSCEYQIVSNLPGNQHFLYRKLCPGEEIYYIDEQHRLRQFEGLWWVLLSSDADVNFLMEEMNYLKRIAGGGKYVDLV